MNASDEHPIEVHGLHKTLGNTEAVRGIDLQIPTGSIFGLIGRNGAGKTTTLNMMLGLLAPDAGEVRVFGENALTMSKACRQRIGYLTEEPFPYDLIFTDVLRFLSRFFDDWDWSWCEHLMQRLDVASNKQLSAMSFGQRRVAELLIAVAHKPDLLILDDPAVGLDAAVRKEMLWTLLEAAQQEHCTIVFASHILQDIERVVDRVGILDAGALRMSGSLDEIKARTRRVILDAVDAPLRLTGEITREVRGDEVFIVTECFDEKMDRDLKRTESEPMNLEEIFVALSGETGRDQ